ncbi:MAG: hypothetical protein HC933_16660 [Pleurocapsa sp. SU_196_0]|nr:hypothetical protein [Pleurocapsa sp. SU_196_0]
MKIYELIPLHHPRQPHLEVIDLEVYKTYSSQLQHVVPLAPHWRPFSVATVQGRNLDTPFMMPFVWPGVLPVSHRMVEALQDQFLGCGELLPLAPIEEGYAIFHPTVLLEHALELPSSHLGGDLHDPTFTLTRVQIHAFQPEQVSNALVFRIPQYRQNRPFHAVYATDTFKRAVDGFKARGGKVSWSFPLVWDSENPEYHDERYRLEQWRHIQQRFKLERAGQLPPPPPPRVHQWRTLFEADDLDLEIQAENRQGGLELLRKSGESIDGTESPDIIVQTIARVVERSRGPRGDGGAELGALWGEQVSRAYGWQRLFIGETTNRDDGSSPILVSSDRAVWISAIYFVHAALIGKTPSSELVTVFESLGRIETMDDQPRRAHSGKSGRGWHDLRGTPQGGQRLGAKRGAWSKTIASRDLRREAAE